MTSFIDLQRRFRDLTQAELEEPELLAYSNEQEFGSADGWPELLKHPRVVLLAEGGSGKTIEMREQVKRLVTDGRFAFFIPLESLDREPLVYLFSTTEETMFNAWKAEDHAPAWFFLDAVDELKLTAGKLDRTLLRLSKAIGGHLDRARVIVSCRPSDWRPNFDLATVQNRLPVPTTRTNPTRPSEEVFFEALRREHTAAASSIDEEDRPAHSNAVRTVMLLPMSDRQITLFADQSNVNDASAFLAEIGRQNAWI